MLQVKPFNAVNPYNFPFSLRGFFQVLEQGVNTGCIHDTGYIKHMLDGIHLIAPGCAEIGNIYVR